MAVKQRRSVRYDRQAASVREKDYRGAGRGVSPYRAGTVHMDSRYGSYGQTRPMRSYGTNRGYEPARNYNRTNTAARGYEASRSYINNTAPGYDINSRYGSYTYGNRSAQAVRTSYGPAVDNRSYGAAPQYPPLRTPERQRGYAPSVYDRPQTVKRRVLDHDQRMANRKKVRARLRTIAAVAVVFLLSAFMIYRQTAIFEKNREIESLTDKYNGILVTNEGIQSGIDRSIELGNLESVAKNQLGMINPDSSQIFYVDMGAKDEVVKSSSSR